MMYIMFLIDSRTSSDLDSCIVIATRRPSHPTLYFRVGRQVKHGKADGVGGGVGSGKQEIQQGRQQLLLVKYTALRLG